MKKSDLVERLAARHYRRSHKDVELAVNTVLETIIRAMANGRCVELRGFGAFSLKHKAPRTGRNPRNGTIVTLGERRLAYFRTGKDMRVRLNGIVE